MIAVAHTKLQVCCSNNVCCNVGILASGPANPQGAVGHMSKE